MVAALALAACAYGLFAPFVLDDLVRVVGNPDIRSLSLLPSRLVFPPPYDASFARNDPSRPVVFLVYTLIHAAAGLRPWAFHAVSFAFHAVNAVLVRRLHAQLLVAGRAGGPGIAFFAAAAFATAPLAIGVATYTTALADLLATAACLGATLAWLAPGGAYRLAAPLFAAALLCKQSAVAWPLVLLAIDVAEKRPLRPLLGRHAAVFGVAAFWLASRRLYFGAVGDIEGRLGLWERWAYLAQQPRAALLYAALWVWPAGQSIEHFVAPGDARFACIVATVVVAVGLGASLAGLRARGRTRRLAALGAVLFLLALAPTSSVMPTVDAIVERRAYLPGVGLWLSVAVSASVALRWARRFAQACTRERATAAAVVLVGVYLAASTFQNQRRQRAVDLWRDVVARYPKDPRAIENLAAELLDADRPDEARLVYDRAIAEVPAFRAIFQLELGELCARADRRVRDDDRALALFRAAAEADPEGARPYLGAARVLARAQNPRAIEFYEQALARDPRRADALVELAHLYADSGRTEEARGLLRDALAIDATLEDAGAGLAALEASP